jgi:DNA-binding transcriptional LysR family regulator
VPREAVAYRTSSLVNQLVAAGLGMGVAVLPCYLADGEPRLRRVLPPIAGLVTELWLVTHDDMRRTARVRAFMALVGDGVRRRLAALEAGGADADATDSSPDEKILVARP